MEFLTNEKLTIVGAAGMIGSNMAQTALMMRLTPHLCLYDPYAPALEGVAEELRHCAFKGVDITFTSDVKEALTGASYIVSSGGAARKAGMTREDLLKGSETCGRRFQSGRYYGVDRIALFGFETVSGIHACGAR